MPPVLKTIPEQLLRVRGLALLAGVRQRVLPDGALPEDERRAGVSGGIHVRLRGAAGHHDDVAGLRRQRGRGGDAVEV